jgi:hypothetical protein
MIMKELRLRRPGIVSKTINCSSGLIILIPPPFSF